MKTILASILFVSFFFNAQADTSNEFCENYFIKRENTSTVKKSNKIKAFKVALKFLFNPKSLVEIEPLNKEHISLIQENTSSNKILINLLSHYKMSPVEKKQYQQLKRRIKTLKAKMKEERFQKKLESISSKEECVAYLETPHVQDLILDFEKTYQEYQPLASKRIDEVSSELMKRHEKSFQKKGWKSYSHLEINQIYDIIQENPKATILIVAHATPEGEIVDKSLNTLPRSFFTNSKIENLIIYSCYSENVIKNYSIRSNRNITKYFYPKLKAITNGLINSSKIPMNSLKTVLKEKFHTAKSELDQKDCILESEIKNKSVSVFINNIYLGSLKKEITFDCSIVKGDSIIEIYSISKDNKIKALGLEKVELNGRKILLKEFISKITHSHIVSKGEFSLD